MREWDLPPEQTAQLPEFYRPAGMYGSCVYLPELVPQAQGLVLTHGNLFAVEREVLERAFIRAEQEPAFGEGLLLPGFDVNRGKLAVKMMHVHQDPEYFQRFSGVVARMIPLDHPHLAQVTGATLLPAPNGGIYPTMIMPHYDGVPASQICCRGEVLPAKPVARILRQASTALDVMHGAQVVHGDVAPKNLLLLKGRRPYVKLIDFGASFLTKIHARLPKPAVWYTPGYVAPEVMHGELPTPYSDQYSLAASALDMLNLSTVGRPMTVAGFKVFDRLPQSIQFVINKALARNPNHRFESAGVFGATLEEAVRKELARRLQLIV